MAITFKEGDLVQIKTREVTAEDGKTSLYYAYFGGLQGKIQKMYTSGEAAIEVNPDSLPEEVARRHEEMRLAMQNKWLDGLSEEAKNRLTPQEKAFILRYNVLVSADDLTARRPDRLDHGLRITQVIDHDARASGGQQQRMGAAKARSGAGDDGHAAVQAHGVGGF